MQGRQGLTYHLDRFIHGRVLAAQGHGTQACQLVGKSLFQRSFVVSDYHRFEALSTDAWLQYGVDGYGTAQGVQWLSSHAPGSSTGRAQLQM